MTEDWDAMLDELERRQRARPPAPPAPSAAEPGDRPRFPMTRLADLLSHGTVVIRGDDPDTVVSVRFSDANVAHEFYHVLEDDIPNECFVVPRRPAPPVGETANIQAEIMRWHEVVFPGRRPLATAKKLLEEASECHVAAKSEPPDFATIVKEAADTGIICYVLAGMAGVDLQQAMRDKLAILVARGAEQQKRDAERGIDPPQMITDWRVETWQNK